MCAGLALGVLPWAVGAEPASVPYMPDWPARHRIQLLVDHAGLELPGNHWPLPRAAVQQALDRLPELEGTELAWLAPVTAELKRELAGTASRLRLSVRERGEGLTGFDEDYTPGSSASWRSPEWRGEGALGSWAGRLGLRVDEATSSLNSPSGAGWGVASGRMLRAEDSALVCNLGGWNLQLLSTRHWWGPGWQSSLIAGSNSPAWQGVGLQRATAQRSEHPLLAWMGPWNLDVVVAKAQDPEVVAAQPVGYLFAGMRLSLRPARGVELGLSRGLQTAGRGRPGGLSNLVKALLGRQTNKDAGDGFHDSSNQIAGFDLRLACPSHWGSCAFYTQWMGEDSAGRVLPLPYKFMSQWGLETTLGQGRHRLFVEYSNTNAYSLPWDDKPQFPGYTNGVYLQNYTQGARWIGSAQGGGSRVTTLGWMDAEMGLRLRLHAGRIGISLGAYDPRVGPPPHGRLRGLSVSRHWTWRAAGLSWRVAPELSWHHLSDGQDQALNRRRELRLGLSLTAPLE